MINLAKTKTEIKELDKESRIHNNDEVIIGYSKEEAIYEANRCLNCKNKPCQEGCPLHNDIPAFIDAIKKDDLVEAISIINRTSPFPFVCSRVCNQQEQCEKNCTRGKNGESVAIGMLERFVCDNAYDKIPTTLNLIPHNGKSVAIIGAGPSGLSCAEKLALVGFSVDVYDALPFAGGLMEYGIPDFRLDKSYIRHKINFLRSKGVHFILNTKVGVEIDFKEIEEKYDYVYLAIGADVTNTMGLENEDIEGVITSNKYLLYLNKSEFYKDEDCFKKITNAKNVVVVGGGNVAMDVSRVALRHGANVNIVYRRSFEEMPARHNEIQDAINEGVKINYLTNPVIINGKDHIESIICNKNQLGELDSSGRRKPVAIEGSEFEMPCDLLIYAIGSSQDEDVLKNIGVTYSKKKTVIVDDVLKTSKENIYAGGDLITGPNTVVHAIRDGIKAAKIIIEQNDKNN
ncbi:MAG: FAD-dependent oxidoreductase [Bacilli bacterium]